MERTQIQLHLRGMKDLIINLQGGFNGRHGMPFGTKVRIANLHGSQK
jgi:hypothetical protein